MWTPQRWGPCSHREGDTTPCSAHPSHLHRAPVRLVGTINPLGAGTGLSISAVPAAQWRRDTGRGEGGGRTLCSPNPSCPGWGDTAGDSEHRRDEVWGQGTGHPPEAGASRSIPLHDVCTDVCAAGPCARVCVYVRDHVSSVPGCHSHLDGPRFACAATYRMYRRYRIDRVDAHTNRAPWRAGAGPARHCPLAAERSTADFAPRTRDPHPRPPAPRALAPPQTVRFSCSRNPMDPPAPPRLAPTPAPARGGPSL